MEKRCLVALLSLIISSVLFAQVPDAMTFQSVIRDAQGNLATNRNITLRISILQGSADGSAVYAENLSGKTNANGLISLNIGRGTPVTGAFADIDWSKGPYFLQVAVDVDGGFNFVNQTTTQLLSVPYALHAQTAEKVNGTISYNSLVDVPENIGFSGKYEDLSGAPALATVATSGRYDDLSGSPDFATVAITGSYNDLDDKPNLASVATSGNYNELSNKPELAKVATSGNYEDLSGKPTLAHVAATGSYLDLTDRPNLSEDGTFSGSYNDLTNRPNIHDSVAAYSFSGNYNELTNVPNFATVAFTGSYYDLTDRPSSIGTGGTSDYNDLYNRPNFKDSVEKYSAGVVDYQALQNKPSFPDSVAAYEKNDYALLKNRPNIRDSVALYNNFTGSYYDLTNRPNIKDSVDTYGFSGNWKDLQDKPTGSKVGALMYFDPNGNTWHVLEPGNAGDLLVMGGDGIPKWLNASYIAQNIANIDLVEVRFNNYPNPTFTVSESTGMMSNSGKLLVPLYNDASFEIYPAEGWGVKQVLVNAVDSPSYYFTDKNVTFLDFVVDTTGTGHTSFEIDVVLGQQTVTYITSIENDTLPGVFINDTSSVKVGYLCDFVKDILTIEGYGLYSIKVDDVDVTASACDLNQIIIKRIAEDTKVEVTYKKNLFSIGEIYKENDTAVGVVYYVAPGGSKAKVINLAQVKTPSAYIWGKEGVSIGATYANGSDNQALVASQLFDYPAFQAAASAGIGWYLPSTAEIEEVYHALDFINPVFVAQGANSLENLTVWTSNEEADDFASSFLINGGHIEGVVKSNKFVVIAIKQISK